MSPASTSFRTDSQTLETLDSIARSMGRSRNWVVNQAIQDYIAYQQWFRKQVEKGIEAADAGRFASDEEMDELFGSFGA